jgi:dimethylargininase
MKLIALTRDVSPALARSELTFLPREAIDLERAVVQHAAYCRLLESLGLEVLRLPADPAPPDCCLTEDTAIVIEEMARADTARCHMDASSAWAAGRATRWRD